MSKFFWRPLFSTRAIAVWRRNFLVWKKLAIPSVLGNLADPMIYMLGLGYGLGALLPNIEGVSYITFLAAGTICYSTMNSATFETLYSSFSRMHVQKTWDAILNAPVILDDVILGEWIWGASKSMLSGIAILIIIWLFDIAQFGWMSLWIVPIIALIGLCFAGMGLVMTALSSSYDFFMYYFTLLITPMVLVSGVFFPINQLPVFIQNIAMFLPLTHAVELIRPLVLGGVPGNFGLHILVLTGYGGVGYYLALALSRRRLLK